MYASSGGFVTGTWAGKEQDEEEKEEESKEIHEMYPSSMVVFLPLPEEKMVGV